MECRQEFQTSKISEQIKQSMSYRRNDLKSYMPSKTSEQDRTIQPNLNQDLMEILLVIFNPINKNLNIDTYATVQAFSLGGDDIKCCNVAAWITALGFVSLRRTDPDRLGLKFLSTPLCIKRRNGRGRCLSSRVEQTSKITPIIISNLQEKKKRKTVNNKNMANTIPGKEH